MSIEFMVRKRLGPFGYEAAFEADQEILVLYGHSGAGKSLTLQFAAGLLRPDGGRISIDGRVVFDSSLAIDLRPQDRSVGYVVQDLALFPHLDIAANIAFGIPRAVDKRRRTAELVELFGLKGLEERRPSTLSGGQQQRVALARALAREARVLLLDEPFSALDEALRTALRQELLRLRGELGLTILFVTHDLREAHLLADRIAVFDGGRVLQFADRETVFRRPANRRVAELTGVSNILRGRVSAAPGAPCIEFAGVRMRVAGEATNGMAPGTEVDVAIRAERVNLRRVSLPEIPANTFAATVVAEFAYGSTHTLRLQPDGPGPAFDVELAARPYEVLGIAGQRRWLVELPEADLHVMPVLPV